MLGGDGIPDFDGAIWEQHQARKRNKTELYFQLMCILDSKSHTLLDVIKCYEETNGDLV